MSQGDFFFHLSRADMMKWHKGRKKRKCKKEADLWIDENLQTAFFFLRVWSLQDTSSQLLKAKLLLLSANVFWEITTHFELHGLSDLIHIITLWGKCYHLWIHRLGTRCLKRVSNLAHITFSVRSRAGILTERGADSKVYVINWPTQMLSCSLGSWKGRPSQALTLSTTCAEIILF